MSLANCLTPFKMLSYNEERAQYSTNPPDRSVQLPKKRRFLGVHYTCCNVYSRAYMNRDKNAYTGSCPSCGKRVEVKIGSGGTDSRFFTAS